VMVRSKLFPAVAAEVRRRTQCALTRIRLLTSAATDCNSNDVVTATARLYENQVHYEPNRHAVARQANIVQHANLADVRLRTALGDHGSLPLRDRTVNAANRRAAHAYFVRRYRRLPVDDHIGRSQGAAQNVNR